MSYLVGKKGASSIFKSSFKATPGQTSVSFAETLNPNTLSVHRNGVLLYKDDYSVSGNNLTFVNSLSADDEIVVENVGAGATLAVPSSVNASNVVSGSDTLNGVYGSGMVGWGTYADLRAYTGTAEHLVLSGRSMSGDGGAGSFVRKGNAADNDGTVIVDALGRSWEREFVGPVNAKWFGAVGDWNGTIGTDNSIPLQVFVEYCRSTKKAGRLPAGRYKITQKLHKTGDFFCPSIFGDGYMSTEIVAVGFPVGRPILEVTGGSGTLCGAVIQGIRFDSDNGNAVGTEIDGQCGMIYRGCQFGKLAIGGLPHNKSAGNFTEYVVFETCDFQEACKEPLVYRRTGGNDSFHGTGLRNSTIAESARATTSQIRIGGADSTNNNIIVYNAPLSVQVWKNATNPILKNNSTRPYASFVGNVTVENFSASALNLAEGPQSFLAGCFASNDFRVKHGTMMLVETLEVLPNETIGVQQKAYKIDTLTMSSGANNLVTLRNTLNETYLVRVEFYNSVTNLARKVYLLAVQTSNVAPNGVVSLGTLIDHYGGDMPYPTFSMRGQTLVATAAGFTSDIKCNVSVSQIGLSHAFGF